MVKKPDPYTQRKQFLAALRDPLCCEVLSHGYMAEFSCIKDLISTAQAVEDTVRYDLGTQHMEGSGGSHIPLQRSTRMMRPRVTHINGTMNWLSLLSQELHL